MSTWPESDSIQVIGGGELTAQVIPQRGGKVASLRDRTGREWLAQPEQPVGSPARVGANFLRAEMAGWDECAPTIVACTLDGRALADHGSLWTAAFVADGSTLTTSDEHYGFDFSRTIVVDGDGLRFDYWVRSERTLPFLWAAHPQFQAPPGTYVELPSRVDRVVDVLDPTLRSFAWSPAAAAIDDLEPGGCRKLYADPERSVQHATLVRPDGALQLTWSGECPYIGLWLEKGMFRREPVIAIEPTTGFFDSLATAVALDRCAQVSPDAPLRWSLHLRVLS
ncbi:hypothetical protein FBY40_0146 [Microbacterium sp. SLBN-154]|uniref:hypothetical protein n=1 Tax=Microbacterium sp. SLBN-154 TaxID=2768458 RepID=UPI00116A3494|nr:hypothetical protein [Microbacterium sp. SLBN-154]TQK17669.1 hypothetical protein FBY40_0146 [Microbacterium sp. SLBN-154]